MSQSAAISSFVQIARQPGLAAGPRIRLDNAAVATPHRHTSAEPAPQTGKPLQQPLLSGETQLAAQEHTARDSQTSENPAPAGPSAPEDLTEEEQKKVQELQRRDREVRAHEQAHKAAGGPHAGSPTFKTVRGPDGRSYAVSGEVKIDTSPVANNPEATIRKLEQVKRAALAPSNPSAQDRRVAAEADAKIQAARQEKREKEAEELKKTTEKNGGPPSDPTTPPAAVSGAMVNGAAAVSPGTLFNLVA